MPGVSLGWFEQAMFESRGWIDVSFTRKISYTSEEHFDLFRPKKSALITGEE